MAKGTSLKGTANQRLPARQREMVLGDDSLMDFLILTWEPPKSLLVV